MALAFVAQLVATPVAAAGGAGAISLPAPDELVRLSAQGYEPVLLKGILVDPGDPLSLDFLVDPGDSGLTGEALRAEGARLVRYFLAALTVPEEDLWVNLSPYEADRIIPGPLGRTEMGRDMLAQDYLLKQLAASLLCPTEAAGRAFWDQVYARAMDEYGDVDIPLSTYHKLWIVPDQAEVFQNGGRAFVLASRLKVMSAEDYLARQDASAHPSSSMDLQPGLGQAAGGEMDTAALREVIIPRIEQEVNHGRHFAALRQIYHALILAAWFRQNLRESILTQSYAQQNKVAGVDLADPAERQRIYERYVASLREGIYNTIQERRDPESGALIPRRYFSGGANLRLTGKLRVMDAADSSGPQSSPVGRFRQIAGMFLLGVSLSLVNPPSLMADPAAPAAAPSLASLGLGPGILQIYEPGGRRIDDDQRYAQVLRDLVAGLGERALKGPEDLRALALFKGYNIEIVSQAGHIVLARVICPRPAGESFSDPRLRELQRLIQAGLYDDALDVIARLKRPLLEARMDALDILDLLRQVPELMRTLFAQRFARMAELFEEARAPGREMAVVYAELFAVDPELAIKVIRHNDARRNVLSALAYDLVAGASQGRYRELIREMIADIQAQEDLRERISTALEENFRTQQEDLGRLIKTSESRLSEGGQDASWELLKLYYQYQAWVAGNMGADYVDDAAAGQLLAAARQLDRKIVDLDRRLRGQGGIPDQDARLVVSEVSRMVVMDGQWAEPVLRMFYQQEQAVGEILRLAGRVYEYNAQTGYSDAGEEQARAVFAEFAQRIGLDNPEPYYQPAMDALYDGERVERVAERLEKLAGTQADPGPSSSPVGGIDLNTRQLGLRTAGAAVDMALPQDLAAWQAVAGFVPQVRVMVPVEHWQGLLGMGL